MKGKEYAKRKKKGINLICKENKKKLKIIKE